MTHDVLHVLGTARPEGASIARIVGSLGELIDKRRFRLHAWFLGEDGPLRGELEARGVATRCLGWSGGIRDVGGVVDFVRALRGRRFAIVHQHQGGRSVRLAARLAGDSKLVSHVHGVVDESHPWQRSSTSVPSCDRVIACSRFVASQIVGAHAVVIHSGVEPLAAPVPCRKEGQVLVGAASRMVPSKGLGVLIDAAGLILAAGINARIEIAGDGPERDSLEREVRRRNLTNVRFLGWRNTFALLPGWDIFVQPSIHEPFGLANIEAMNHGLPVVASATGGIPEIVQNGSTGLLVEPGDAAALAKAILRLVRDPLLRHQMGVAGKLRVAEHFSSGAMARAVSGLYEDLLALPEYVNARMN
ncbi:glycosyltransferase family 4 protein [Ramlibacter sp. PS4R-6]|uniref:glycosyltransferase family 4 protein n=1 Tax=Ramlibacter sp. PS4R-6 TaxID=3133438 RepID=UPI0030A2319B